MILDILTNNLTTIFVFGILFILTYLLIKTKRPPGIPPGPRPIPYVGNVLQLRGDIRKAFRKLREQYGDVFSVFFGNRLIVVVNGYEALKETFVKNGDSFSDRPTAFDDFIPEHVRKAEGVLANSGEVWRNNRRFTLSTLRDFGMGKNILQVSIQKEAMMLVRAIESFNGKAFDISHLIGNAVSNIICSIAFGKRFEYDDQHFQHLLNLQSEGFRLAGFQGKPLKYRLLRKLPGDITQIKRLRYITGKVFEFIKQIIEEHLETFDEDNINSIIDAYIKQEKLNTSRISSEDIYGLDLIRIIFDLFTAGTETTNTTLRWSILYYMNYPTIQKKIYTQIADVVDPQRSPGVEDRKCLPYLEAMISEVQRHGNIAPFAVAHVPRHATQLGEYHIPQDCWVIPNLDSAMTDPKLWNNPEQFDPDRFMEDGVLKKVDHLIPFGLGKRICLGESLARMELTIFLATLTRHFEFLPADGESPPPIEGELGSTFAPNPYIVRAVKRTIH